MDESSDEELMRRFCDGEDAVFDVLFERYSARVQAYMRGMVSDGALADDLTQATFLSIVRSKDRYLRGTPVASWVFAIATNAARDALRRRGVERTAHEQLSVAREETADPQTPDPPLRRQLEGALQALPSNQREAVLLREVQGLSYEQVAQSLGITETAVRIRCHRGFQRLRELLSHLEGQS